MILKWTAAWYELDQTIIVGDKDWFYLPSNENNHSFFNELYQSNSFIRKKLEIEKISHPVLGDVKGIVAIGLDYTVIWLTVQCWRSMQRKSQDRYTILHL